MHAADALNGEQSPHAAQFGIVPVFASQPSPTVPLQFANPALQLATVHCPPEQPAVPFVTVHWFPHEPQFETSLAKVVSQLPLPSQSPVPAPQLVTPQTPFTQFGV